MKVEKRDDGSEILRDERTTFRRASMKNGTLWLPPYFTQEQLREIMPYLIAWCETGTLENKEADDADE